MAGVSLNLSDTFNNTVDAFNATFSVKNPDKNAVDSLGQYYDDNIVMVTMSEQTFNGKDPVLKDLAGRAPERFDPVAPVVNIIAGTVTGIGRFKDSKKAKAVPIQYKFTYSLKPASGGWILRKAESSEPT